MKKNRILVSLAVATALLFGVGTTALAADNATSITKGYIWNSNTNHLEAYDSLEDDISVQVEEVTPATVTPRGIIRTFHSYSPTSYSYDYNNAKFKIGMARVDNSSNMYSPANLTFTVEKSGSCCMTTTTGETIGSEVDAIYLKAQLQYNTEVSKQVLWTKGTKVETNTSVPAGQIGRVTAYVIGIYSGGTAKYEVENTATQSLSYDYVAMGALIPTTNVWNLVVEIPCD